MSDARLRELERQAATGDEDARARLLLERERLGHFTRERLALAAHAGDPAARRALDLPAEDGLDLLAWARGFYAFGQHACVRVVAAAAHRRPGPRVSGGPDLLEVLEPWLACPCDEHAAPVVRLSRPRSLQPDGLPGALLGVEWDRGPAVLLRVHSTREEADRATAPFAAIGGVTEVVPVVAGGVAVRLRECFGVLHKIALIKEVRAASGFGLAEALGAVEGVNAVPRSITELATALGGNSSASRAAVSAAITAWALDPASR